MFHRGGSRGLDRRRSEPSFTPDQPIREMPDPYGGEPEDFDRVLDLVEEGVEVLLKSLREGRISR